MDTTIGVQLYSLRDQLADLDGVLGRLGEMGVTTVEPYSIFDRTAELASALARNELAAPTGHSPFLSDHMEYEGRRVPLPPLEVTLQAAQAFGLRMLVDPMVAPERWRERSEVERTAERMNAAADQARAAGISVAYHNHSFEFHHMIEGVSAYEYFVSLLDPSVCLELDIYWVAASGTDVVALVKRLGTRVRALHLKDGPLPTDPFATAAGYDPGTLDQCALGDGDLNVAATLMAASSCRYAIVEFDNTMGNIWSTLERSVAFLKHQ